MCSQKCPDRFGRVAAAPKTLERRQARIVPPGHLLVLHELQQFSLAHDRVADVQAGKLDLLRTVGCTGPFDNPVIERAMVLELQSADRMCHAFDRIGKADGQSHRTGKLAMSGLSDSGQCAGFDTTPDRAD